MAYDRDEILEKAIAAIKKEKLTFFDEISLYVLPSKQTLYDWEFDKVDAIRDALEANRLRSKQSMRKKWQTSRSPALQISAYRLMATTDELSRLTMTKVEQSGPGDGPIKTESKHIVEIHDYSTPTDKAKV